jgi:hypothetical protein
LANGAKRTQKAAERDPDLQMSCVVMPFINPRDAQQFEWAWTDKRFGGKSKVQRLTWAATRFDEPGDSKWTSSALSLLDPARRGRPYHIFWLGRLGRFDPKQHIPATTRVIHHHNATMDDVHVHMQTLLAQAAPTP